MNEHLKKIADHSNQLWLEDRQAEAVLEIERALQNNPGWAEGHGLLGNYAMQLSNYAVAEDQFRRVLRLDPQDTDIWLSLGLIYERVGRIDTAIKTYRQAVSYAPDNASARNRLAIALAEAGRAEEAVVEASEAVRLAPADAYARTNLADLLSDRGRLKEAIVEYQRAVMSDPGSSLIRYNFGLALEADGRTEEAFNEYQQVLRQESARLHSCSDDEPGEHPILAGAHCRLGKMLLITNEFDEAILHFAEAVSAEPSEGEWRFELGAALSKMGKTAESLKEWQAAAIMRNEEIALLAQKMLASKSE